MSSTPSASPTLVSDIRQLIEDAHSRVAATVNAEISRLYWCIGKRIAHEVLQGERADYGAEIIKRLAHTLTQQYGRGWSEKQLRHCLRSAETFPDETAFSTLRSTLS